MTLFEVITVAATLFVCVLAILGAAAIIVALGYWLGLLEDQRPNEWGYGYDPDSWNAYMDRAKQESADRVHNNRNNAE